MADGDDTRECPYCKEQVKKEALVCKHCRSRLTPSDPGHGGTCPFCKETIDPEAVRCKHCQSDLSQRTQAPGRGGCGCGCAGYDDDLGYSDDLGYHDDPGGYEDDMGVSFAMIGDDSFGGRPGGTITRCRPIICDLCHKWEPRMTPRGIRWVQVPFACNCRRNPRCRPRYE